MLPNLLFLGAVFFVLTTLSRSLLFTYLGIVGFFVGWGIATKLTGDLENHFVASLVDPFGLTALGLTTRYWTTVETNTLFPPLIGTGHLLLNRVLWMAVGLAVFAVGSALFDPARTARARKKSKLAEAEETEAAAQPALKLPVATQRFSAATTSRSISSRPGSKPFPCSRASPSW